MRMHRAISLVSVSLLLLAGVRAYGAQVVGQNKSTDGSTTFTLSVKTQLVVETVVVKDKKGNPIDGLTAKDFTITEDGVEQKIRFCEHEMLPVGANAVPVGPAGGEDIKIFTDWRVPVLRLRRRAMRSIRTAG